MDMELPKVEWPGRTCRDAVWGQYVAHNCELPDMHEGPCASQSVLASMQRREAWEKTRLTAQQTKREEHSA
jgi:hypothetical protein